MNLSPTKRIAFTKEKCIEISSNRIPNLPKARNTLVEDIFENPELTNLLALTMDRLERKRGIDNFHRVKGCEEFIEFRFESSNDKKGLEPSHDLLVFAEELTILIEELEQ
jgi:hypothetical protein